MMRLRPTCLETPSSGWMTSRRVSHMSDWCHRMSELDAMSLTGGRRWESSRPSRRRGESQHQLGTTTGKQSQSRQMSLPSSGSHASSSPIQCRYPLHHMRTEYVRVRSRAATQNVGTYRRELSRRAEVKEGLRCTLLTYTECLAYLSGRPIRVGESRETLALLGAC